MIGLSFLFGVALIGAGAWYIYNNKSNKQKNEKWIWVGEGKNPFK